MKEHDQEAERLRQLRNRQLQARDPGNKQRKIQHHITTQYRRVKKQYTLRQAWRDIHSRWKGLLFGLGLGILVAVLLSTAFQEPWADLVGILAILVLGSIGLLFGSSFDWRDDLRDL